MKIKFKLINHLTLDGKKEVSEKNLLKSIKNLQKNSNKCSNKIFQITIIYLTPIFKLHRMRLKNRKKNRIREIPGFLQQETARISIALKFLIQNSKKNSKYFTCNDSLFTEVLTCSKNKGENQLLKKESQKSVIAKKRFFKYYRWK